MMKQLLKAAAVGAAEGAILLGLGAGMLCTKVGLIQGEYYI